MICALVFDWPGYNHWMPEKEKSKQCLCAADPGLGSAVYGNCYITENQMQSLETLHDIEKSTGYGTDRTV